MALSVSWSCGGPILKLEEEFLKVFNLRLCSFLGSGSTSHVIQVSSVTTPDESLALKKFNLGKDLLQDTDTDATTQTDPCNPNPCARGSCLADAGSPGGWVCLCPAGYTGQDCSQATTINDPCNPSPCFTGTCTYDVVSPGGWRCICPQGFVGQDCSQPDTPQTTNCPLYPCPGDVPRYFYPDWDDLACINYYSCEYGVLQRRTCPNNQQFDLLSQACRDQLDPSRTFCSALRI